MFLILNCSSLILLLTPVVQTLDSALHQINHCPVDKYKGNQLQYPLDGDKSSGLHNSPFEQHTEV